ncbi:MAG: OmpH family outer membrane protein [Phycisphaerales bacterium]
MTNRTTIVVAALTLVLGVCAPSLYSAGREMLAPPPPAVIAVISIEKVFNGLEERAEMKRDFDETQARLQQELTDDLSKIDKEKDPKKLEMLPTDADRLTKLEEIATMTGQLKIKQEVFSARIERKQAQMYIVLYDKINKAVAKLAKDRGFTLVLASDDGQLIPRGARAQDIERFIALKRVFYVDPAHDVSDDLITLMNNQHKAGK